MTVWHTQAHRPSQNSASLSIMLNTTLLGWLGGWNKYMQVWGMTIVNQTILRCKPINRHYSCCCQLIILVRSVWHEIPEFQLVSLPIPSLRWIDTESGSMHLMYRIICMSCRVHKHTQQLLEQMYEISPTNAFWVLGSSIHTNHLAVNN